jgi:hypothetical protein
VGKLSKQQRKQLWQQQQGQQKGKKQKKGAGLDQAGGNVGPMSRQEQVRRDARASRFADGRAVGGVQSWEQRQQLYDDDDSDYDSSGDEELDLSTLTVKGTSTDLEKSYFRLTAAPHPGVVRARVYMACVCELLLRFIAHFQLQKTELSCLPQASVLSTVLVGL